MRILALLIVLATTSGCEPTSDSMTAGIDPAPGKADSITGSVVTVLDRGEWSEMLGCSGFCVSRYNIWLDIAVRDDSYDKQVGVLWTTDGWITSSIAYAGFERSLGDSHEIWGLDVVVDAADIAPPRVEVAVFARMSGSEYWDPANNYFFFGVPERASIQLDAANFRQFPCSGGIGVCEARLDVTAVVEGAPAEGVFLRWTRNDWASFQDAALAPDSSGPGRFSARVNLRTPQEIAELRFSPEGRVEYKAYAVVGGVEVWESGDNHVLF